MIKDIGSIFPVFGNDDGDGISCRGNDGSIRFSLCREALLYAAVRLKEKGGCVMLPSYTCQTVIDPFLQAGLDICFYSVGRDLTVNAEDFRKKLGTKNPSAVLVHPYYGMGISREESALLEEAKRAGAVVIADLTQSVFLPRDNEYVDIYVGSLRKWLGMPDGAFLYQKSGMFSAAEPAEESERFVTAQRDAMYLRGRYMITGDQETKNISIRLNKYAERLAQNELIVCHRMSGYSSMVFASADIDAICGRRTENFAFLASHLDDTAQVKKVIDTPEKLSTAPLYFPVYAADRKALQAWLAMERIYAPVLWPTDHDGVITDENAEYIYEHILAIPVDQRYDTEDMKKIINRIGSFDPGREKVS